MPFYYGKVEKTPDGFSGALAHTILKSLIFILYAALRMFIFRSITRSRGSLAALMRLE
ncbi:hypothetical protein KCP77_07555 [Salmonella enterica subsp. enterica]|nr:hypothetical protein KCP77_07555 [Salmonella enterica subsp. enterica]